MSRESGAGNGLPALARLGSWGPNALSASRLLAAAGWARCFMRSAPWITLPAIALAAAATDFLDGRLARRLGGETASGRWLDSTTDVVFVLVALGLEARAGAIPSYIPLLIAISFSQYALDSLILDGGRSRLPIRSRLGHWGGIINYALVIALSLGHAPSAGAWEKLFGAAGSLARSGAPLLAVFYLLAITERAYLLYRRY